MFGKKFVKNSFKLLFLLLALNLASSAIFGQNPCLTKAEADKVIRTIKNPLKVKSKKKIRREILKMQEKQIEINQKVAKEPKKDLIEKARTQNRNYLIRLCGIFKEYGWLRKNTLKKEGLDAALYLIRNSNETDIQRELFPVIVEATQKGLIPKGNLASLIDKIRIETTGRQVFGTQIKIKNEIGYLYPLENESNLDKWRKMYDLPPISEFIKLIEIRYRTIVVRMPQPPNLKTQNASTLNASQNEENKLLGLTEDEDEILNIESSLVNLNVRVLTKDLIGTRNLDLKKEDFLVYENSKKQEISFFSTTDTPFDLVLLLDLSGSTIQKQQLIADSARRFIDLARPNDRIAIVAFADYVRIVSEFTSDKKELFEKIQKLDDSGSSRIWDALDFTYRKILKSQRKGRRSAIVFMTDGLDNTLMQNPNRPVAGSFFFSLRPSKTTFTELLEKVRKNDANIFSIYLDTEYAYAGRFTNAKSFRQARRTLKMLSEESGGQYYKASQIENLSGIYERIINDLSEVYSIGYEPNTEGEKGTWRELNIKIKDRPDLIVKSKKGYYAK